MSRLFKILLVGFGLGFELIFVATFNPYPHGQIVDVHYRRHERMAAMMDYRIHPSLATKARFREELRLMHKHEDWKMYAALGLLVVLNCVGIYILMARVRESTTAS